MTKQSYEKEKKKEEEDVVFFFFFNDTATTEIYTLSLHDALPIWMIKIGDGKIKM